MTVVNYSKALAWRKAHLRQRRASGQFQDAVVVVSWPDIPLGGVEGCRDWLKANRATVTGSGDDVLQGDHQTFSGVYRLNRTYGEEHEVFAEYILNHASSISWEDARIVGGDEHATGDEYLIVKFPSLKDNEAYALMASVRGQTYTDPTINGEVFTGTYYALAARPQYNEEQGSFELLVVMGDPQYSLTAFQNYLLPTQQDITYIWNLPKAQAQTIINGYQTEGTTVAVSHSMSGDVPGTVDLVISEQADVAQTALEFTVGTSCDIHTTHYHRWGMTRAQAEAFLAGFETKEEGVQKQVSLSFSQETGKYSAVATVTTRSLETVALDITIGAARLVTSNTYHRWNLTKTEAESFAALFQTREEGVRKRVSISRKDGQCVYDAIAIVESKDLAGESLQFVIGARWDASESYDYRWGIDKGTVQVLLETYAAREDAIEKNVRLSYSEEDGTFNFVGLLRTNYFDPTQVTGVHGTIAEQEDYDFRFQVSEEEMFSVVQALENDEVTIGNRSLSVSRNGDDTYNINIRLNKRKPTQKPISWTVGTRQNSIGFYFAQTPSQVDQLITALDTTDVEYSFSLNRSSDGTFDFIIRASTDLGDVITTTIGTAGSQTLYEFHYDLTHGEVLNEVGALGNDTLPGSKSISLSRRDGKFNLTIRHETLKNVTFENKVVRVGGNYTEYLTSGYGKVETDLPSLTLETGKLRELAYNRNTDGYVTYQERKRETTPKTCASFVINKIPGETWNAYAFLNHISPPELSTSYGRISSTYDPETDTYSGTVVEINRASASFEGDQWDNYELTGVRSYSIVYRTSPTSGKRQYARLKTTYDVLQTKSMTDAKAHVDDTSGWGSDIQVLGEDRFRAIKVTGIGVWKSGTGYVTTSVGPTGAEPDWSASGATWTDMW